MKKAFLSFLSLLFVPVILFAACGKNGDDSSGTDPGENPRANWDGMSVKNFDAYKAIGAAQFPVADTTAKATAARFAAEAAPGPRTECNRLVGIKADGTGEELRFVGERGETAEQYWELSAFNAFDNFSFFSFRPDWTYETELMDQKGPFFKEGFGVSSDNRLLANYQNDNYILDNKTGKVFGVLNILDALITTEDKAALRAQASEGYVEEQCSLGYYLEQSDYSYLAIQFKNEGLNERYGGYYQLGAEEEKLKVRQVLSYSKFVDFFTLDTGFPIHNVYVDIYGNIFTNLGDDKYLTPYMLKQKTAQVSSLQKYNDDPQKLYMAMNNIMYYLGDDGVQCFDENGELVPSEFTPPTNLYCDESMFVASIGNTDFYRQYLTVHQFTFLPENEFSYRRVELEVGDEKTEGEPIYANEKFYFLSRHSVFYCDLLTGAKTELVGDCQFKTLKLGWDGRLYFTGLNENLDEIYGIIGADDTVEIDVKEVENNFRIVYVKPLN